MIIGIVNHKGGVSKTTTSICLGYGLRARGYRVLLVDFDPQSNLTFGVEVDLKDNQPTITSLINGTNSFDEVKVKLLDNLDLLPSDVNLASLEPSLISKNNREKTIIEEVIKYKDDYDFIIIDTPPSLGILTINAIMTCDKILIPFVPDSYSISGLLTLIDIIKELKDDFEQTIEIIGYLPTKIRNTKASETGLRNLVLKLNNLDQSQNKIFKQKIRFTTKVDDSINLRKNIFESAKNEKIALDYNNFIDELLEKLKGEQ